MWFDDCNKQQALLVIQATRKLKRSLRKLLKLTMFSTMQRKDSNTISSASMVLADLAVMVALAAQASIPKISSACLETSLEDTEASEVSKALVVSEVMVAVDVMHNIEEQTCA